MTGQVSLKINYLILFLLFSCIKLSVEDEVIKLEVPGVKSESDVKGKKLYQIALKNGTNLTNYTKIEVSGDNEYIISYYKDDFKNRKQLSKISKKAIMWLSKDQMKGASNISVECNANSCSFTISIELKDKIELNIGEEPYTYYVTEENKKMEFHIKGSFTDSKLSVWAKGNKKVVSSLPKASHNMTKDRYQTYLIEKQEENNDIILTVTGSVGDLIEVGALIIKDDSIKDAKYPILGFLQKDVLGKTKIDGFNKNNFVPLYDQENSVYPFINGDINTNEKYGDKFLYAYDYKKKINDNFYEISPLMHGVMYEINLEKDKQLGLIPMTPENNFEYMAYYAKGMNGNFSASIYSCKNYPLCTEKENVIPLLFYNSSSYIFKKDKYDKDISAISQKQNMLVLKCESESCLIYANMYTNNNKVTLSPEATLLKDIKQNTEENFIISLDTILPDNKKYFSSLNVETISGDITVVVVNGTKSENGNIQLFEKELEVKGSFNIKIKANKNSVYNLAIYYEKDNTKLIPPQANCLIKFKGDSPDSQFSIRSKETKENLFVTLSGLKSNTTVEKDKKLQFNEKRKFVQDSYENNEKSNEANNAKYKVKRLDKSNPYLYTVSTFRIFEEANKNKNTNYVLLGKGATYPVLFDGSKYKKINYMYLYEEGNDNLKINFTVFDDKKYNLEIYLNDKAFPDYNNITKNNSYIELTKEFLKNHSLSNQPCKINLHVSPQKYDNNPIMEIVINGNVNSGPSSKSSSGGASDLFKNPVFLIGGGVILVLLIILIIAIGLLCYTKNVNKDLKSKITSTSFQDGGTGPDDREEDLLE